MSQLHRSSTMPSSPRSRCAMAPATPLPPRHSDGGGSSGRETPNSSSSLKRSKSLVRTISLSQRFSLKRSSRQRKARERKPNEPPKPIVVKVPASVAERLAHYRNKRKENSEKSQENLSFSNLLSVTQVKRELHSGSGEKETSASGTSDAPADTRPRHCSSSGRFSVGSRARLSIEGGIAGISIFARNVQPIDPLSVHSLSYVTPEVNKKIRLQLLKLDRLTNRFVGSAEAATAEVQFSLMVSRYQLKRVVGRLSMAALCITIGVIEPFTSGNKGDTLAAYLVLHTIVPVVCFLLAAALCSAPRTRGAWRGIVILCTLTAYNCVIWADAVTPVRSWTEHRQDYSMMLQCIWLMIVSQFTALGFSLDFVYVLAGVLAQWVSFVVGVTYLWVRWHTQHMAMCDEYAASGRLSEGAEDGAVALAILTCNGTSTSGQRHVQQWALIECILLATLAIGILLAAVRSINRFERQSFINQYVLLNKTVYQEKQKNDTNRALLALFSNPSTPQQLQLKPLQLGQEIKFLLRSIPPSDLACEPAASLVDVEAAIRRCAPRFILFSGHSFAGSLAFELPNGRIELPPPDLFIKQLENAHRLQCCFLNGCNTGELGRQIVMRLPDLKVICWASVAEDTAARSFALGFYDAVGAFLSAGEDIPVEIAFWAGLERFATDGFRLGDPSQYLHPPGHPHTFRPIFSPPCPSCCPPVHGTVQLLRWNKEAQLVERLDIRTEKDTFSWELLTADRSSVQSDESTPGSPSGSVVQSTSSTSCLGSPGARSITTKLGAITQSSSCASCEEACCDCEAAGGDNPGSDSVECLSRGEMVASMAPAATMGRGRDGVSCLSPPMLETIQSVGYLEETSEQEVAERSEAGSIVGNTSETEAKMLDRSESTFSNPGVEL